VLGHWKFDESGGKVARDCSSGHRDAVLKNMDPNTCRVAGHTGKALHFDGHDDYLSAPALNYSTNYITMTAWVKTDANVADWSGIIFTEGTSTFAGLNVVENKLRYHWGGTQYEWDSGLTLPKNKWVFVAMAVEPSCTTLYLGKDGKVQLASSSNPHRPLAFDGPTFIGACNSKWRFFKGDIDDVRIYNWTLGPEEIDALFAGRDIEPGRSIATNLVAVMLIVAIVVTVAFVTRRKNNRMTKEKMND
jgi:hypothetical protein